MKPTLLFGTITAVIPLKHTLEVRLECGSVIYFKLHHSESIRDYSVNQPFCAEVAS